jgi:ubiquinone/menaquinone biosynthesis C-methylase UbiE
MPDDQWRTLAPRWERARELLWTATRPVSEWLVERLDPSPGDVVLDLAAGTGDTGLLAAARLGPGGRLISGDLEPAMVEAAKRLGASRGIANAEFRVLDGRRLDLATASVDGVLCRFGYILKGDPPPALREIRRVLRPGRRLAFAVWAERNRNPWMTVPTEVMVGRGHLSAPAASEVELSARRNPDSIARLLAAAGFSQPEVEEMPVAYRFADPDELWFFVSELRGPVTLALANLDEAERAAVRADIEALAGRRGTGFELTGVSLNVLAA